MYFQKLPWKIQSYHRTFVPSRIKVIHLKKKLFFIAWRQSTSIVLTFPNSEMSGVNTQPTSSQVISTTDNILDVVRMGDNICYVFVRGSIQVLCSVMEKQPGATNLFSLVNVYEFSPMKNVLAVCTLHEIETEDLCDESVNFCAVTACGDGGEVHVELYCIAWESQSKAKFKLVSVLTISHHISLKANVRDCKIVLCTRGQVMTLFEEFKGFEVLLVSFYCGHIYSVPFQPTIDDQRRNPTPRLLYHASLTINEMFCPADGNAIFVAMDGGTFTIITPLHTSGVEGQPASMDFKTITMPSSLRSICASSTMSVLCSNGIDSWHLQPFQSDLANVRSLPLKGVIAMCEIRGICSIVATTLQGVVYELDFSKTSQCASGRNANFSTMWTGISLEKPLQYVKEMKEQTELLAYLREQLRKEDSMITALSTASRAPFLAKFFSMSVKVDPIQQLLPAHYFEKYPFLFINPQLEQNYQISIEICNNSTEEFVPYIWGMCVEVLSPSGKSIVKCEPLPRTLAAGTPVSFLISVTYLAEEMAFPVEIKAHLVAELADSLKAPYHHWLSIPVGRTVLDVSHFFTVTSQSPHTSSLEKSIVFGFVEEINRNQNASKKLLSDVVEVSYNIGLPEPCLNFSLFYKELVRNCHHSIDKDILDLKGRNSDNHLWISVNGRCVNLVAKKSCPFFSISSSNIDLLHLVRRWILEILSPLKVKKSDTNARIKAKNLKTLLEMHYIEEDHTVKSLLTVYHELRSSVALMLP